VYLNSSQVKFDEDDFLTILKRVMPLFILLRWGLLKCCWIQSHPKNVFGGKCQLQQNYKWLRYKQALTVLFLACYDFFFTVLYTQDNYNLHCLSFTCNSLSFSRLLIQFLPWPWGSINNGNLVAFVVIIPFWTDNSSFGRPWIFHSPI
jgi:hypothetical protein